MTLDLFMDYIRMVGYAIVVLTSLRGIFTRKFSNLLFVGDIIMASAFIIALFLGNILGLKLTEQVDIFVTPAVVIWAVIHFYAMWRSLKVA
jgi:hypothetical protein